MTERDVVALVVQRPSQNLADRGRSWHVVQDAMATGDKYPQIRRLLGEAVSPDLFELEGLADLVLVLS